MKNKILVTLLILILSEVSMAIELKDKYAVATEKAFNGLNINTINILDDYYDANSTFRDPITNIKGLEPIKKYYAHVYEKVQTIHFVFTSITREGDTQAAAWTMHMVHPSLNGGKEMTLDGFSLIKFNLETAKVISHRDYYDMGEFVYEKVPLLGSTVRFIKARMKPQN